MHMSPHFCDEFSHWPMEWPWGELKPNMNIDWGLQNDQLIESLSSLSWTAQNKMAAYQHYTLN